MMMLTLLAAAATAFAANLVTNGDFERGLDGWSTAHKWYAQPRDAGLSEITVVEGEGRDGSKALKIVGGGKRGIAMQVFPAYPGQYRVSGWIKCAGLDAGEATILVEWMSGDNRWLRGDPAGSVRGTHDWQRFETIVIPAPETRSVHLDLLTSAPNNGTVWFDDIAMERIPSDLPPPQPPQFKAQTPPGQEGCLEVTWDPTALSPSTVRLLVYCETEPIVDLAGALPRAAVDSGAGKCTVWSLENGKTYYVAATAVDADLRSSGLSASVEATVVDRQPPRVGWVEARWTNRGREVEVSWSPDVLDKDIAAVCFVTPGDTDNGIVRLKEVQVAPLYSQPRPFYCTTPWVNTRIELPEGATAIGALCRDHSGNEHEPTMIEVQAPHQAAARPAPCALWSVPPTYQIRPDADPPAEPPASPELVLMRGQAKGFQVVVHPEQDLHRVRIRFAPLVHENEQAEIAPLWLAYHFVNYVTLERNSRATPEEELVWKAPAEYPDELSDDPTRDLPAGKAQPVYIRVTAPRDAVPGLYRGQATLECDEGSRQFDVVAHVLPPELPEDLQLKFVYWYSWDTVCQRLGVEPLSEDGWRVLCELGRLMHTHHQNCVTVPWTLVHTWRRADGTLAHDFRDFDRYIRTFQQQRVDRLFCIQHIGGRTTGEWECPTMRSWDHRVTDLATGERSSIDAVDLLPAIEQHVAELGLLDRFAVHVADEPIYPNLESYKALAARVKAAAPRLRRIDAIHVPDLEGSLEIWVPQLNYFQQWLDRFRQAQAAGNEIWFYVAWVPQGRYPNRMIDSSAIKPRVLHWLNAIYDTSGYLHWALNWWDISLMSLESPGDQYICWPSKRFIANSSLRYEAEREGLEDCELMFMLCNALAKRGTSRAEAHREMEAIARKAVRGVEDYTRSWQELEAVRREMLQRLGVESE